MNIYITSMEDYAAMNKACALKPVYGSPTFQSADPETVLEIIPEPRPARTCVAVAELPFKTDVSRCKLCSILGEIDLTLPG
jgi:hypothetical protein